MATSKEEKGRHAHVKERSWQVLATLEWHELAEPACPSPDTVQALCALSRSAPEWSEEELKVWLQCVRGMLSIPPLVEAVALTEVLLIVLNVCTRVIEGKKGDLLVDCVCILESCLHSDVGKRRLSIVGAGNTIMQLGEAFVLSDGAEQSLTIEVVMQRWHSLFLFLVDENDKATWNISMSLPDSLLAMCKEKLKILPPRVLECLLAPLTLYARFPEGRTALREGTSLADTVHLLNDISWRDPPFTPLLATGLQILAYALTEPPPASHSMLIRKKITHRVIKVLDETTSDSLLIGCYLFLRSLTFHTSELEYFARAFDLDMVVNSVQNVLYRMRRNAQLMPYVIGFVNNLAMLPSAHTLLLSDNMASWLLMAESEHRQVHSIGSKVWSSLAHLASEREGRKKLLQIEPADQLIARISRSLQVHRDVIGCHAVTVHALLLVRTIVRSKRGLRALKESTFFESVVAEIKNIEWEQVNTAESGLLVMETIRQAVLLFQFLFSSSARSIVVPSDLHTIFHASMKIVAKDEVKDSDCLDIFRSLADMLTTAVSSGFLSQGMALRHGLWRWLSQMIGVVAAMSSFDGSISLSAEEMARSTRNPSLYMTLHLSSENVMRGGEVQQGDEVRKRARNLLEELIENAILALTSSTHAFSYSQAVEDDVIMLLEVGTSQWVTSNPQVCDRVFDLIFHLVRSDLELRRVVAAVIPPSIYNGSDSTETSIDDVDLVRISEPTNVHEGGRGHMAENTSHTSHSNEVSSRSIEMSVITSSTRHPQALVELSDLDLESREAVSLERIKEALAVAQLVPHARKLMKFVWHEELEISRAGGKNEQIKLKTRGPSDVQRLVSRKNTPKKKASPKGISASPLRGTMH